MNNHSLFIEIFPEEMKDTPVSTLLQVLKDENASLDVYADAALLYMQQMHAREAMTLLEDSCEQVLSTASTTSNTPTDKTLRVRLFASAGIAQMATAAAQQRGTRKAAGGFSTTAALSAGGTAAAAAATSTTTSGTTSSGGDHDFRQQADQKFTQATKVDNLFPMTWVGRAMLNLANGRYDQAKFFFQTTLKQCGPVLPALLGMAAVAYNEGDYAAAQEHYAQAMAKYPSGAAAAATRVGFGLACYRLGQVDRAKAAFQRALAMDPDCVEAMVGAAVLDMSSLDETARDFSKRTETAIKMMSMANLLDHSNAMVQNHLANHYFWKWTPVTGTVQVEQGASYVTTTQHLSLEPGERIRIGTKFETIILEEEQQQQHHSDNNDDTITKFTIQHPWKDPSATGLSVWKKDYDRVISLAKGAYSSTSNPEIQAESLFFLARVYHVREDTDNAYRFYDKAVKLAPALTPARFGLAQTMVVKQDYNGAINHLQQLVSSNTTSATSTDALALLGLLQVQSGEKMEEGLGHLRKAIELDPLNPDFMLLEALALQQHKTTYAKALDRYEKAIQLIHRNHQKIPFDVYANSGVLCHETKKYKEAMDMYKLALAALDAVSGQLQRVATLDNVGLPGGTIRLDDNDMFCDYVDANLLVEPPTRIAAAAAPSQVVETTNDAEAKEKESEDAMDIDKGDGGETREKGDSNEEEAKNDNDKNEQEDEGKEAEKKDAGPGEQDGHQEEQGKDEGDKSKQKRTFKLVEGTDTSSLPIVVGDRVRFGEHFCSEIVEISIENMTIVVKDDYDPMDGEEGGDTIVPLPLFVKRENRMLKIPEALTVAFNIARLHEATGRILPAIELHKAILKRNPAYVNSSLRLACIAVDCGCLKECSEWLKIALTTSPTNPEVRTLIGNLHLSLCDYASAQPVFDGLLAKKVPNVEAYAALSLGNIYFANLSVTDRYAKHLQYASDFYKGIMQKDSLNAYAANGLGTVLAEKGELFKAKEVFNRVRETSGDTIADALLNLGHIYLAQKKHPEALQMYQSYMKRAEDVSTPVSSKSRIDDVVDVLMYIAFAYFDWARHTELFNDANAAPADGRYKQAMEHLELALSKNSKKDVVLKYNLCMTKLQAANCVLQKLTRNIPRTVEEVEEALEWLEESLLVVEDIVRQKSDKSKKISIPGSTLQNFLIHCRHNIESAKSHLDDEKKRRFDAEQEREIHKLAAEAAQKEAELQDKIRKAEEAKEQEMRDRKAEEKMQKVDQLRANWENEQQAKEAEKAKKARKMRNGVAPGAEDFLVPDEEPEDGGGHGLFDDSDDDSDNEQDDKKEGENIKAVDSKSKEQKQPSQGDLFGDSDESDNEFEKAEPGAPKDEAKTNTKPSTQDLFGDSDEDDDNAGAVVQQMESEKGVPPEAEVPGTKDLFGESDDDSDEELVRPDAKRDADDNADDQPSKKRRVLQDDE